MLLDDKVKEEVKKQFESLKDDVKLIVFTQKIECQYCEDNRSLAKEISGLSDKISLEVFNFQTDKEKKEELNIDRIPAIVITGKKDYGIRFYGIPAGYEFTSLLTAIKMVSTGDIDLSDDTKAFLDGLDKDINIQVFVTPTCHYCPSAVVLAHKLAYYSDKVTASMVEVSEFPHLAVKYGVQGVPRTVINEKYSQEGAAPEAMLIEKIKEAIR